MKCRRGWPRLLLLPAVAILLAACDASAAPVFEPEDPPPTVAPPVQQEPVASFGLRPGVAVIGESVQGRPIEAITVGEGPRTLVIIGGLHTGIEAETVGLVEGILEHFESGAGQVPLGVQVVFIPNTNPDGLVLDQRVNANGVDLNRNWPTNDWAMWALHGQDEVFGGDSPLSEPETTALHDFLITLDPDFVLTIHGYAGVVHHNGTNAAAALAGVFGEAAAFEVIDEWTHYEITGELIEALAERDIAAADVELQELDPDSYDRILAGVEAVLQALATTTDGS